jgi:hypothetical protein
MNLFDKVKWVLGILMIITLVITTNLVDRNNFLKMSDTVETIYEDRLVAKDLLLKISNLIHKKEIAAITLDLDFYSNENKAINDEIGSYISIYGDTKLTSEENKVLVDFKGYFSELQKAEIRFSESDYADNSSVLDQFPAVKTHLNELAEIQMKEGNRQLQISKRVMDTVDLFTQIEIYIMIFLAVIIQIIIMYKPKE